MKKSEEIKTRIIRLYLNKIEKALEMKDALQKFASSHYNHKDMYFLGRGLRLCSSNGRLIKT